MAAFINTNMASLNTQNNLNKSQSALNLSIQRLSSGLRVNSAKDDAAGYAIASRMDSTIRGQAVAIRNANDAISYSQTAEGALSQISDNLQRMRELAVQAANGSNGATDNISLNTEFAQLQAEVTRISGNTQFNGINVLSGGSVTFQVGAGTTVNDQISISSKNLTANSLTAGAAKISSSSSASALGIAQDALKAAFSNALTGATTPTAGQFNTATGQINTSGLSGDQLTAATAWNNALTSYGTITGATFSHTAAGGFAVAGTVTPATLTADLANTPSSAGIDILTSSHALLSLTQIDNALNEVNSETIKHGANQNRFAAVINTLQAAKENQTAARSRIMDTDYAAETANLARNQILQQAGMAMLAQANQIPNNVMTLLK